jgi:cytochrome c-type biogenesis protein CcmE
MAGGLPVQTPEASRGFVFLGFVVGPARLSARGRLADRGIPGFGVCLASSTAPRLRYWVGMDPARKRRVRLIVALSAAVLLAVALVYTSFNASSEARSPSQLLASAAAGRSYQLTGKVVKGSIERNGTTMTFKVRDRNGNAAVPVRYTGAVADTFRDGREVIVTVKRRNGVFVGEKDSLVTKCPSKFSEKTSTT